MQVKPGKYFVRLVNAESKTILNSAYDILAVDSKTIHRPPGLAPGVYYLLVQHSSGVEHQSIKLLFK
jgi:hypothetical protein